MNIRDAIAQGDNLDMSSVITTDVVEVNAYADACYQKGYSEGFSKGFTSGLLIGVSLVLIGVTTGMVVSIITDTLNEKK